MMPANQHGAGTTCDRLPKKKRIGFDDDDAEAEGHEDLVLVWPANRRSG